MSHVPTSITTQGPVVTGLRGRSIALAFAVTSLFTACGGSGPSTPTSATPDASPLVRQLSGPSGNGYSQASRYGDLVWTAGQLPIGVNPDGPFETQVEAVLDNLEATLEEAGAGLDTVLKTNAYLLSFADWETFNEIYVRRVGANGLPPRTTVQVADPRDAGLPLPGPCVGAG